MAEYGEDKDNSVHFQCYDNDTIRVQVHLDGKPGNWVEYNLEQFDEFIDIANQKRQELATQILTKVKEAK